MFLRNEQKVVWKHSWLIFKPLSPESALALNFTKKQSVNVSIFCLLENLKYFNDMVTVDLGHMNIFHCEWAASMPNLQFLILADTPMKNIEPLRNCKELIYFEVFDTPVTDFTPLLECTKLRDLNMCWTDGDPEVIAQLTWLERLWWWGRITLPFLNEEEKAMITEAMPNCEIVFRTNTSTGSGWREGELYYKMRDNLGMEYMK